MTDKIWIINKDSKDFSRIDTDLGRKVVLKSYRPMQMEKQKALEYIRRPTIFLCAEPEKYLNDVPLNRLVIRDAGIGDLLLLEPCLRTMSKKGAKVTILTRFPEVYENNPHIDEVIQMNTKAEIPEGVDVHTWDTYDDLRSYSETCVNRDTIHRTDCYNQKYDFDIKDKEPRIYFKKDEKSIIVKKKGFKYIGIACDGSHFFRRYAYGNDLITHILEDPQNIVVIIGDGWKDDQGYIKAKPHKRVVNLQGKTTIRQMINVVKDLDYLIAVDTGIMHVGLTLHIPTIGIFSIIHPELRNKYYTGSHDVIFKDDLDCIGCGSLHMAKCKHEDRDTNMPGGGVNSHEFIPPCLQIQPAEIYDKLMSLEKCEKRILIGEVKKNIYVNKMTDKKLTMPIIVLNEERNLPRFIELVMKNPLIGRVVAIDGGSDDSTASLLKKAGAEVYMHYYDPLYHDMQALQRNISCSYVRDDERIIIMDIDECFSKELSNHLPVLAESNIDYALLSRRTFNLYEDIDDPTKQIKDYPDYQPRFFTWQKHYKWVGSPHHNIYNTPEPLKVRKDIIHFEKENKNRDELESQWAIMQKASEEVYV